MITHLEKIPSPIGALHLALFEDTLCAVGFEEEWEGLFREVDARFEQTRPATVGDRGATGARQEPVTPRLCRQAFDKYFDGDLTALDVLAVDARGTEFQERVWYGLREIPAGSTISYVELARKVGRPKASRAVGAANGANPVPLVLPCHRVIGANGSLVGYGGGLERKIWLLRHEGAVPAMLQLD